MSTTTPPPGWTLGNQGLVRTVSWPDFAEALAYVIEVGKLAQAANHHPDIDLRWNKVTLTLMTHSAGKVTKADYGLAEEINRIAAEAVHQTRKTLL